MSVTTTSEPVRLSPEEIDDLKYLPIDTTRSKWEHLSAHELNRRLILVCNAIEKDGGSKITYNDRLRRSYVTIQILLNECGAKGEQLVAAPAFRKRLKLSNRPKEGEQILSNDTQIIDLHYFWLLGHRNCDHPHGHKAFGLTFGFDDAYKFVRTAGSTKLKLELLGLDTSPGKGLCRLGARTLRLKTDYETQRRAMTRRNSIVSCLDTAHLANRTNKHLWVTLLLADEYLNRVGLQLDNERLADMVSILTGEPVGPKNRLMDKLRSAKKALDRIDPR